MDRPQGRRTRSSTQHDDALQEPAGTVPDEQAVADMRAQQHGRVLERVSGAAVQNVAVVAVVAGAACSDRRTFSATVPFPYQFPPVSSAAPFLLLQEVSGFYELPLRLLSSSSGEQSLAAAFAPALLLLPGP